MERAWQEEYAGKLGVRLGSETELFQLVQKMLSMQLPPAWKQGVDKKGRTYFYNMGEQSSAWRHPLEETHAELCAACRRIAGAPNRLQAAGAELETFTRRVEADLANWREVVTGDGQFYYYRADTKETTWDNPRDRLMDDLAAISDILSGAVHLPEAKDPRVEETAAAVAELEAMTKRAEAELLQWREVLPEDGVSYFYHIGTGAILWENPREKLVARLMEKAQSLGLVPQVAQAQLSAIAQGDAPIIQGDDDGGVVHQSPEEMEEQMSRLRRSAAARAVQRAFRHRLEWRSSSAAATRCLQGAARGFLARAHLQQLHAADAEERRKAAATRVQAGWRGRAGRASAQEARREADAARRRREDQAASRIQAAVRRRLRRKRAHSAVVLQTAWRARCARERRRRLEAAARQREAEASAAAVLQRGVRRFLGTRHARRELSALRKARRDAVALAGGAVSVQRMWRCWLAGQRLGDLRRERRARSGSFVTVDTSSHVWLGAPGCGLGIDIDGSGVVRSVDPKGLVAAWNRVNRAQAVRLGQRLERANTARSPADIAEVLRSTGMIEFVIASEDASRKGQVVCIDRSMGTAVGVRGSSLGMEWNRRTLAVTRINAGGVLALWNAEHEDIAVRPGDRLLSVNNRFSLTGISEELQGTCVTALVVDRPLPPRAATPAVVAEPLPETAVAADEGASVPQPAPSEAGGGSAAASDAAAGGGSDLPEVAGRVPPPLVGIGPSLGESPFLDDGNIRALMETRLDDYFPVQSPHRALGLAGGSPARADAPAPQALSAEGELVVDERPRSSGSRSGAGRPNRWRSRPAVIDTAISEDVEDDAFGGSSSSTSEPEVAQAVAADDDGAREAARQRHRDYGRVPPVVTPSAADEALAVLAVRRRAADVGRRGRLEFDPRTSAARAVSEVKFVSRYYGTDHIDEPTAQFEHPASVMPLLRDVADLCALFPGRVQVVRFFCRPKPGCNPFGVDFEKWSLAVTKSRADLIARTLEDIGIPQGRCAATVEVGDEQSVRSSVFRFSAGPAVAAAAHAGAARVARHTEPTAARRGLPEGAAMPWERSPVATPSSTPPNAGQQMRRQAGRSSLLGVAERRPAAQGTSSSSCPPASGRGGAAPPYERGMFGADQRMASRRSNDLKPSQEPQDLSKSMQRLRTEFLAQGRAKGLGGAYSQVFDRMSSSRQRSGGAGSSFLRTATSGFGHRSDKVLSSGRRSIGGPSPLRSGASQVLNSSQSTPSIPRQIR